MPAGVKLTLAEGEKKRQDFKIGREAGAMKSFAGVLALRRRRCDRCARLRNRRRR